ncbi:MAG: hypothetical protein ABIT76_08690 [Chthoniobacterales bacterium]
MNDPVALRKLIRTVLSALPHNRRLDEGALTRVLESRFSEINDLRTDELRIAIEFNHSKGWIEYTRNHDEERDEWFLTERGRTKEGL